MTAIQRNFLWLTCFALAMALNEASPVVHLRSLYYPDNSQVIFPLSLLTYSDLSIELSREPATIKMILGVSLLAETGFTRVLPPLSSAYGISLIISGLS